MKQFILLVILTTVLSSCTKTEIKEVEKIVEIEKEKEVIKEIIHSNDYPYRVIKGNWYDMKPNLEGFTSEVNVLHLNPNPVIGDILEVYFHSRFGARIPYLHIKRFVSTVQISKGKVTFDNSFTVKEYSKEFEIIKSILTKWNNHKVARDFEGVLNHTFHDATVDSYLTVKFEGRHLTFSERIVLPKSKSSEIIKLDYNYYISQVGSFYLIPLKISQGTSNIDAHKWSRNIPNVIHKFNDTRILYVQSGSDNLGTDYVIRVSKGTDYEYYGFTSNQELKWKYSVPSRYLSEYSIKLEIY